jgi:release factor glutamine methyltransferase
MSAPDPAAGSGRSWRELLAETAEVLGSRNDARRLVEEASGYEGADLVLALDEEATVRCGSYLTRMVERRLTGEPLQYVLGRWGFRSLDLMVDRRVLIPRPETEQLVEWALEEGRRRAERGRRPVVADLGTGSGAIAVSLAAELGAEVWATDVSPDALDVARANLAGLGTWAATRVRLLEGWWWTALPSELREGIDIAVANPPYVAEDEILPPEVEEYEPRLALRSGPHGLDAITEIVSGAPGWLAPGGVLLVELAPAQAPAVRELARRSGAVQADIRQDALGRDRALVAHW